MKFSHLALLIAFVTAPPLLARADGPIDRQEVDNRITEDVGVPSKSLTEDLQRYQNARGALLGGWLSGGGGILIRTRFGDTPQVHWVASPGAARQQLTFYDDAIAALSPNPTRPGFAFAKDEGGSEFWQLYYFDLATRSIQLLTDGKSRNENPIWSNRGDRVAFSTTSRNGVDADVFVVGLDGKPGAPVFARSGTWDALDWSPDDRRLIVSQYVSAEETRPWLVNVETGVATPLSDPATRTSYDDIKFSRDGKGIYYTSTEGGDFHELRYRDLITGARKSLTSRIPWDVERFVLSGDGRRLAFSVNQDGVSVPHLLDLASGAEIDLPAISKGVITAAAFSPEGDRLALALTSPSSPSDVYVIDIDTTKLVRWTKSEVGGLDPDQFVEPTLIHYPTFDTDQGKPRLISALYYKPKGSGPFPVVVQIHGGPEDQARPTFESQIQFWVNKMNIAVLMPNVRGSTGYGRTYLALDNGFKREDAVKDVGALLDWIATRPELDHARVGVYGGSYGGFMALSSMTHFNARLRAGVELVGQSNFVTFLENTESYRRDLRRAEYGDERDPTMRDFLQQISPATNASKITVPLFVAVGANDPRVPASEGERIATAVRRNGGAVWFLEFKDEGHGFQKKHNRDYFNAETAEFWREYLVAK